VPAADMYIVPIERFREDLTIYKQIHPKLTAVHSFTVCAYLLLFLELSLDFICVERHGRLNVTGG